MSLDGYPVFRGALPEGMRPVKHHTSGALAGLTLLECDHPAGERKPHAAGWESCRLCHYSAAPSLDGSPPVKVLARLEAEAEPEQPALF